MEHNTNETNQTGPSKDGNLLNTDSNTQEPMITKNLKKTKQKEKVIKTQQLKKIMTLMALVKGAVF